MSPARPPTELNPVEHSTGSSPVVVLMGVSGVGKSTIGRSLSERLGWSFVDGDEYHSAANVAKMRRGEPLDDADRGPWLIELHHVIETHRGAGRPLVLACSALKQSYRDVLVGGMESILFVHLRAAPELLASRLAGRRGHYMPPSLLASQLEALEPPSGAVTVDAGQPVEETVDRLVQLLGPMAARTSKLRRTARESALEQRDDRDRDPLRGGR